MILGSYFLLLLILSVQDARTKSVNPYLIYGVYVLGLIKILINKENRWVSLILTCICFVLLCTLYGLTKRIAVGKKLPPVFGGADVRLIPGMMLVQGWDKALTGVFFGLAAVVLGYYIQRRKQREIPLIPWMSAGCFLVEIFYLFSGKSMI